MYLNFQRLTTFFLQNSICFLDSVRLSLTRQLVPNSKIEISQNCGSCRYKARLSDFGRPLVKIVCRPCNIGSGGPLRSLFTQVTSTLSHGTEATKCNLRFANGLAEDFWCRACTHSCICLDREGWLIIWFSLMKYQTGKTWSCHPNLYMSSTFSLCTSCNQQFLTHGYRNQTGGRSGCSEIVCLTSTQFDRLMYFPSSNVVFSGASA